MFPKKQSDQFEQEQQSKYNGNTTSGSWAGAGVISEDTVQEDLPHSR